MPFGKYRDVSLILIPSGYLKYLIRQDWFVMRQDEGLVVAVEKELDRRDRENDHFWDEKVRGRE